MKSKSRKRSPLPEVFSSPEAAADFWDTHDTTDYPAAFTTVKADIKIESRRFEIEVDEDVARLLARAAKKKKVRIGRLASNLLREDLAVA